MYAIVRAGGRQEKVAVGDVVVLDRVAGELGSTIALPALLLVDGAVVTTDASVLAKVSVTGAIWCRAQKSSIVATVAGEPSGDPEMDLRPPISENAATGTGSNTAPTTCSRPSGASAAMKRSQSSATFAVTRMKSNEPASFPSAALSRVPTTW